YDYKLRAGRFFRSGAREVVVPLRLANKAGVGIGRTLRVGTPAGLQGVRVVGILTDTGAGRTNQGDVAFTSLATARKLAGRGDVVSGASIVLDPGQRADDLITAHQNDLGIGLAFQNADQLAKGFRDFLNILGTVF